MTADTLEARVARLERSARRWRMLFFGLIVMIVVAAAVGGQRPAPKVAEEVKAKLFTAVNDKGEAIVSIGTTPDGADHGILIFNKEGKPSVLLNVGADGNGSLNVFDGKRQHHAALSARAQGGSVMIGPSEDKVVFFAGSDDDGKSYITLQDKKGNVVFQKP